MDSSSSRVRFITTMNGRGEQPPAPTGSMLPPVKPTKNSRKVPATKHAFEDDDSVLSNCSDLSDEVFSARSTNPKEFAKTFPPSKKSHSAPVTPSRTSQLSNAMPGISKKQLSSSGGSLSSFQDSTYNARLHGSSASSRPNTSHSLLSMRSESVYSWGFSATFSPMVENMQVVGLPVIEQCPVSPFTHLSAHFMRGQRFPPPPTSPQLAMSELPGITHPQHLTLLGMPKGVPRTMEALFAVDLERQRRAVRRVSTASVGGGAATGNAARRQSQALPSVPSTATLTTTTTVDGVCIPTPRVLPYGDDSSQCSEVTQCQLAQYL